ncbi:MAG: type II toxin-antitoxin system RelB/DinJ family antitoxin [Firmicutes bacterium]|nr:type II toxin-antitoxin system RelB/DinJ family antitoxin [Bacillota bacterium]
MAASNMNIRMDSEIKAQAQAIFAQFGLDMTTAINMFLRQAIRERGIPFDLRLEQDSRTTAEMKADILQKVAEAEADFAAGREMDAYESLRQVREKHGI